jgi:prepilin-type N-terminal cleavage/methylation domain-containing protein
MTVSSRETAVARGVLESTLVRMVKNRAGVLGGRHVSRGITLVELMIVVAIMSVLAGLGVYGVKRYIESAKSHEATNMIKAIKEAQETYRGETDRYLPVSSSLTDYYPSRPPWPAKIQWGGDEMPKTWKLLNVYPDGPTYFSYASTAGTADSDPAQPFGDVPLAPTVDWPATTDHWYVVKAIADLDGDGEKSAFVGSSFTSEIWIKNEGD